MPSSSFFPSLPYSRFPFISLSLSISPLLPFTVFLLPLPLLSLPFPPSSHPSLIFRPLPFSWNSVKRSGGALKLLQRGLGRNLGRQRIWGTLKLENAINGINFGLFSSTKEVKLTSQCTSQSPDKHTGLW